MKDTFYITTPIYYVNDLPHIGHAYSSVLADSVARYHRLLGGDVFFSTGTDEHGAKIKRAADNKNKDVQIFVDENVEKYREMAKILNVSNDYFTRTTDKKNHWPTVEKMWRKMNERGDIYKDKYKGLYCVGCEAFITEKDLVGDKCVYHNAEPEVIEEENYFFKLSGYQDKLKKIIASGEFHITPETRRKEVLSFLEQGLEDISISRPSKDLKWGVPVPDDNSQTIYVWVDALCNYLSVLEYGKDGELFKKFWPADLHVLGKEILRFHAVIWPAMLLSASLALPKGLLVHGFINIEGQKMSKTIGNVVYPEDIIKLYSTDALRFYFLKEVPPFDDGDFSEERLRNSYNANLANGLGNFVSRVFKMAFSYFEGHVNKPDDVLLTQVSLKKNQGESYTVPYVFEHTFWPEYKNFMRELRVNGAVDTAWRALSDLDTYVQDYQPFKLIKTDREKTAAVLWSCLAGLANICWMILPFMPETAQKIMDWLAINHGKKEDWGDFNLKENEILFPRKD